MNETAGNDPHGTDEATDEATRPACHLRLGRAQGAERYFLGDRPLSGGDVVELCTSGGWLSGRFEWEGGVPTFHFSVELSGGEVEQHEFEIHARALLRLR